MCVSYRELTGFFKSNLTIFIFKLGYLIVIIVLLDLNLPYYYLVSIISPVLYFLFLTFLNELNICQLIFHILDY